MAEENANDGALTDDDQKRMAKYMEKSLMRSFNNVSVQGEMNDSRTLSSLKQSLRSLNDAVALFFISVKIKKIAYHKHW